MRRREPSSTTTVGICGTFQLHNSTPMHTYPPPRPRTWQMLVNHVSDSRSECSFSISCCSRASNQSRTSRRNVKSFPCLSRCHTYVHLHVRNGLPDQRHTDPDHLPLTGRSQTRGVHKPYRFTSSFSRSCLTTEQATVPAWPAWVLSCRSSTVFARFRTMSVATSRDEVSEMLCCGVLCWGRATCRP